jgi:hypothetical protein
MGFDEAGAALSRSAVRTLRQLREVTRLLTKGNRSCTEKTEARKDSVRTIILRREDRVNKINGETSAVISALARAVRARTDVNPSALSAKVCVKWLGFVSVQLGSLGFVF